LAQAWLRHGSGMAQALARVQSFDGCAALRALRCVGWVGSAWRPGGRDDVVEWSSGATEPL
jgi:hypothetical protein